MSNLILIILFLFLLLLNFVSLLQDVDLVKFAIGRFVKEFYDDVRLSVEDLPVPAVGRRTSFFQLSKKRNKGIFISNQ